MKRHHFGTRSYLLTEAVVYIGAMMVLLGVAVVAMHRCIDNSLVLRRNADDVTRAMHIGERWRADVRTATSARLEASENERILRLERLGGTVDYRVAGGAVYRRAGSGPWSRVLDRVRFSSMQLERRSQITACHWDLELEPQSRGAARAGRVRPLFSFIAPLRPPEEP